MRLFKELKEAESPKARSQHLYRLLVALSQYLAKKPVSREYRLRHLHHFVLLCQTPLIVQGV